MRGSIIERTRTNQPTGYAAARHSDFKPVVHYGVHHNYAYYPFAWTDPETGRKYEKGYYDENGEYYEDVAFRYDGAYRKVLCKCEYCDTVTRVDMTENGPLICPQCGGTMKLLSALDEYTQDPLYEKTSRNPNYVDYADVGTRYDAGGDDAEQTIKSFFKVILVLAVVIILFAWLIERNSEERFDPDRGEYASEDGWVYLGNGAYAWIGSYWDHNNASGYHQGEPVSDVDLFGTTIYLKQISYNSYAFTDDQSCDKILYWDSGEDSYYDGDSDLWLWYNTDVYPNLWQYWYEPISGDYGDYGWMEYEDGIWYIEQSAGNWIRLPDKYDTGALWHFETASDSPEDLSAFEANPSMFNSIIYLNRLAQGVYTITGDYAHDLEPEWSSSERCYVEPKSGIKLGYNTNKTPARWQYWYKPISGNLDGSGWLEYEDGVWYADAGWEERIPLPEQFDTSPLWHITDGGSSNPSLFGSTIRLDAVGLPGIFRLTQNQTGDKLLDWDSDQEVYRDEETGLCLWYSVDEIPRIWKYWYGPISGDYGQMEDHGGPGWLEYDRGDWFVITADTDREFLPEKYDVSPLWHILWSNDTNISLFGETLSLSEKRPGVYGFTRDEGDKQLFWIDYLDVHEDPETGMILAYSYDQIFDWKYRYEPISSDYGELGWLIRRGGEWYIESEPDTWIPLPDQYDASALWYVEP